MTDAVGPSERIEGAERVKEIEARLAKVRTWSTLYELGVWFGDHGNRDMAWLLSSRAEMGREVERLYDILTRTTAVLVPGEKSHHDWRNLPETAAARIAEMEARERALVEENAKLSDDLRTELVAVAALTREAAWWEAEAKDALRAVTIECPIKVGNAVASSSQPTKAKGCE